jgi:hypothetical protein
MADAVQDTYATVRESDEPSEASFQKKKTVRFRPIKWIDKYILRNNNSSNIN